MNSYILYSYVLKYSTVVKISKILFVINIIMSSQENNINLLKQLPFYGKTIKSKIKKFTNAKLLSELPFFKKTYKSQN